MRISLALLAASPSALAGQVTPTITTWPTASVIASGQSLAASTLSGGSASVSGTFGFTAPATVPPAGVGPQSVTFSPSDTVDYSSVAGSVNVTVGIPGPVISWSGGTPGILSTGALAGQTVVAVAQGAEAGYGLTSDGRVYAWGDDTAGQLGDGGSGTGIGPVPVYKTVALPLS